ncbi:MAG: alpha/beta hydrolase [Pyrinomonadaceae bacterium]
MRAIDPGYQIMGGKALRLTLKVATPSRSTSPNDQRSLVRFALLVLLGLLASYGQTHAAPATRVETIQFQSKLINSTLPYNVVLPSNYDSPQARTTRYPVLYLLHGLTGHYSDWTSKTSLAEYAAEYGMIIVTPEGNNGWYTDSATTPTDNYETYILQELIPDVRNRFRTIETREARAIAGLSMGGYGALKFGVKHPEQFVFVASMSGALSAASWTEQDLRGHESVWRSLRSVFGPPDSAVRAANDLHQLYRGLAAERFATLPYVYLDCGTEDALLQSSRALADILLTRKIPHEFRQLPGAHNWNYWNRQVADVLRIAGGKMNGGRKPIKATAKSISIHSKIAQSRQQATTNH